MTHNAAFFQAKTKTNIHDIKCIIIKIFLPVTIQNLQFHTYSINMTVKITLNVHTQLYSGPRQL